MYEYVGHQHEKLLPQYGLITQNKMLVASAMHFIYLHKYNTNSAGDSSDMN